MAKGDWNRHARFYSTVDCTIVDYFLPVPQTFVDWKTILNDAGVARLTYVKD